MNVVVSAIVDPWVTTLSFVVALAMRIQGKKLSKNAQKLIVHLTVHRGVVRHAQTLHSVPRTRQEPDT